MYINLAILCLLKLIYVFCNLIYRCLLFLLNEKLYIVYFR